MTGVRIIPSDMFATVVALEGDLHRNGAERYYKMPMPALTQVKAYLDKADRTDRNQPFVIDLTPTQRATLRSFMSAETAGSPEALQVFAGYRYCDGLQKLQSIVGTELALRQILGG